MGRPNMRMAKHQALRERKDPKQLPCPWESMTPRQRAYWARRIEKERLIDELASRGFRNIDKK